MSTSTPRSADLYDTEGARYAYVERHPNGTHWRARCIECDYTERVMSFAAGLRVLAEHISEDHRP